MKNKKAIAWQYLIALVLGIFFLLVMLPIIYNKITGQSSEVSAYSFEDYDRDGVADSFDKCVCKEGDKENDGCPYTMSDEQKSNSKYLGCPQDVIPKNVKK